MADSDSDDNVKIPLDPNDDVVPHLVANGQHPVSEDWTPLEALVSAFKGEYNDEFKPEEIEERSKFLGALSAFIDSKMDADTFMGKAKEIIQLEPNLLEPLNDFMPGYMSIKDNQLVWDSPKK